MAPLTTLNKQHINQSLDQIVYSVDNDKTPFTAMLKKQSVGATMHEWLIEEHRAANLDNALAEGGELTDTVMSTPVRARNYTQIFREVIPVTGSLEASDTVGGKESVRQKIKAGVALKKDLEATFLSAQAANDGSAGARRSRGVQNWLATNVVTNATVTEAKFRELLTTIYASGGTAKKVLVSPTTKASMNAFNGGASKQQDASKATVYGATDIYKSDFGVLDIVPSLYVANSVALVIDPEMFAIGQLRKMFEKKLGATHDADRVAIITECTLISKNEKGSGVLRPAA